ncbi:Pre-mRNA-splicing factor 38A [Chamberlinius hualienensis]
MANRTVKEAHSVKGTNPQYLVEKIIRSRIYDSQYWKEECFALSAELLVDKAMELTYIGGVYGGNIKPTPFICLILKMLQIQPEKDIIVEFIKNEDFKYVRALGAYYMRLVGTSLDCYKYLEPLYNDYRKLKRQKRDGDFEIVHFDELIDELLREERVCDVILPRIQKRYILEESNELDQRVSALDDLEEVEESEEEPEVKSVQERNSRGGYRDLDRPRSSSPKSSQRSPAKRRSKSPSHRRDREHKHNSGSSRFRESRHRSRSSSPSGRRSRRDRDDDKYRSHKERRSDRHTDRNHRRSYKEKEREQHLIRCILDDLILDHADSMSIEEIL